MTVFMDGQSPTFSAGSPSGSGTQCWSREPRKKAGPQPREIVPREQGSDHRNRALGSAGLGSNIWDETLARPAWGRGIQVENLHRCKVGAVLRSEGGTIAAYSPCA